MKHLSRRKTLAIWVLGSVACVGFGLGYLYFQMNRQQWCVRFASDTSQEVTYSRGCISPNRYKKWVITS